MAKRGRPAKAKPEQVERVINANVLVQLIKTKAENKSAIGELNGELSGQIKHHTEMSGLNKPAFAFIAKLNGMKEHDRDAAMRSVQLYADMMVEKGVWPSHVGDLADQAEAASNSNEPASPPPSDDEQVDIRPPHLIAQEQQRLEEEAVIQRNTNALSGISPLH